MKHIRTTVFAILAVVFFPACQSRESSPLKIDNQSTSSKIEIYYFHYTHRCMTCNTVEKVTEKVLNELFANEVKSGIISFKSLNLDEKINEIFAEKIKISGQALIFISGSRQTDLTNDAFMYAVNQPEKLKAKIKETVESLK